MLKKISYCLLCVFSSLSFAQETVETVIARMQAEGAVEIAYQETRYMGLFDEDWHGSGYLYAALPNILLKQQIQPDSETMAAEGEQLTYAKPAINAYHQLSMDENNPLMASLSAFKGIMTGNVDYLRQHFILKFLELESSWQLAMTAKYSDPEDEQALKIIMQGANGQAAQQIEVLLPDGDRSLYILSQPQQGRAIKVKLNNLLHALKEH